MTPRRLRARRTIFGLGLGLVLGIVALGPRAVAAPAAPKGSRPPTIYHKSRSFRIPFTADQPRLREVHLWVSEDSGYSWKPKSKTTPDRPYFSFKGSHDGEYWFAVRTLDDQGRLFPVEDENVEPSLKVVVDTVAPSLVIEPDGRRGSLAAVRWEARDEHLDIKSLMIEYQAEGARQWRQVPINRLGLIGGTSWDAGTAEPLKVRASVDDKAGNTTEVIIKLAEGTPSNPALNRGEASVFPSTPPVSPISSGPNFSPVDDAQRGPERQEPFPTTAPSLPSGMGRGQGEPDVFGGASGRANPNVAGGGAAPMRTLVVPSPRFALKYAVDDAGPNGPASLELWITRDGGQTWTRRGEDPDHTSPIDVDLGGEGTYGITLVARSVSGLGDQPPAPGDPPQTWVEVDSTPPAVQLDTPIVGTGLNVGKVAITWRATDLHLAPRPVTLSWRPDLEGAQWQPITPEALDNSGRYIWTVPGTIPPKFHVKIEVVDTMGNKGTADTATLGLGPVIVDRTRPKSRIIGLDPPTQTGAAPANRPF